MMITPQPVRRQLSLFAPPPQLAALDAIRAVLDPIQYQLIPAHVTACRDEEMHRVSAAQLERLPETGGPITLSFGRAVSFEGHGVLLPCIAGQDMFAALRLRLLGPPVGRLVPHITLAHPRNPKAARNDLAIAFDLPAQIDITFEHVCLIEQRQSEAWRVLQRFPLA